jgi:hypothetical protein
MDRHLLKIGWAWIGLLFMLSPQIVMGHTGAQLLVPENDYVVKWYQPHGEIPVEYWDIEITPIDGTPRSFIEEARVSPDRSCWGVDVPIDERARVRIRGVSGEQVSGWSGYTVVPEPAFALSCAVSVGMISLLAGRRFARAAADKK